MSQPTQPNQASQHAAAAAPAPEALQHDPKQLRQELDAISAQLTEELPGLGHQWVLAENAAAPTGQVAME